MSEQDSQTANRYPVNGTAIGLVFTGFFSAIWGLNTLSFLGKAAQRPVLLLVGLITLAFWAVGLRALFRARSLAIPVTGEALVQNRKMWSWFGLIFGTEMALIFLARLLLFRLGAAELILPAIALIVGLHFLPLARVFAFRPFTVTGLLLYGIAVTALLGLGAESAAPGRGTDAWLLFGAAGAALVLWITGLLMTRMLLGWH